MCLYYFPVNRINQKTVLIKCYKIGGGPITEEASSQIAKDIIKRLHKIAEMRKSLQKYK